MVHSQPFPLAPKYPPSKKLKFGPDLAVRLTCPACKYSNARLVEDLSGGYFVCACGVVLGDRIVNTKSERRTRANAKGDDASRLGSASDLLMDRIERSDTDTQFAASLPRSLRDPLSAIQEISNWCDQFSESETISHIATQLYERSYEARILRFKPLEAVIGACIFVACRQAQVPRTFREICDVMRVSKKVLGQCYKALVRAFGLTHGASMNPFGGSPFTGPENLLVRYCDHLDLSPRVLSVCSDIIVAARKHGIAVGRSPVSIAGAALSFTCHLLGEVKSIQDICAVAGVSVTTLKIIHRLFYINMPQLVKQEWIDEGEAKRRRRPLSCLK